MAPQPPNRFQNGPPTMSPYHNQYASHPSQTHQPPSIATAGFLSNPQMSAFGATNGLTSLGAGFGVGDQTGLASQAARMGFAHGAQLQQQQQNAHQQSHSLGGDHPTRQGGAAKGRIRDVWKHNVEEEIYLLEVLVQDYKYVAMDTEFPGIVGRPMGGFTDKSDYHYQTLRVNVDMLKIIQIGIALFNEKGETPPAKPDSSDPIIRKYIATHGSVPYAWQFNFNFDIKSDMANQASIESLQSAGIDFDKLERDGMTSNKFAALWIPSGLVQDDRVNWISFHGGYDFGYFTKCLMDQELPNDGRAFEGLMKKWFPTTYDVKHLMKYAIKLQSMGRLNLTDSQAAEILSKFEQKSGLENAADIFKVKRLGIPHQAGSDALLTGKVFFQIRERIFGGDISNEHIGKIWGLAIGSSMQIAPLTFNYVNTSDQKENTPTGGPNGANGNGNAPSTPSTSSVGLVTTPAASHNTNGVNIGVAPMTPGGGGGVFGGFFNRER